MGVWGIFSRGVALGDFFKIFLGREPKVVKFDFSQSKLRKQPFLLKFSKSRGVKTPCPPSNAHAPGAIRWITVLCLYTNYMMVCPNLKCLHIKWTQDKVQPRMVILCNRRVAERLFVLHITVQAQYRKNYMARRSSLKKLEPTRDRDMSKKKRKSRKMTR